MRPWLWRIDTPRPNCWVWKILGGLMCDRRFQASYLGGCGGEKSMDLYLRGSGERSQSACVGGLEGGPEDQV